MASEEDRRLRIGRLLGLMPTMSDQEQAAALAALSPEDRKVYAAAIRAGAAAYYSTQPQPEPAPSKRRPTPLARPHGWRWTAFVNGWWKGVGWGLCLLLVLFILLAHSGSPSGAHAPAYEQQQAKLHEENLALAYQEEQLRDTAR